MITLFKKIRQNLVSDGKTGKYIRYAIGEIILVVIGILIALAINNWNSERNEISKYNKQLLKLADNIKSDTLQLRRIKQERLKMIYETSQMIQELQNKNIKDPESFLISFLTLTGETKFVSEVDYNPESEFEKYHIAHIHNLLDDYLKILEKVKFREYRHNEFSENMELDLWKNGLFRQIGPKFNKELGNKILINNINKVDLEKSGIYEDETLYALLLRADYGFSIIILEYDELSNKGIELLEAINDYFDTTD